MKSDPQQASNFSKGKEWLTGQMLIAMPGMPDPRFSRAVVYICSHTPSGAMGLVINRLFAEADFRMLLDQLSIESTVQTPDIPIHFGGPVEIGRGFMLHTNDYYREGTTIIDETVSLSATLEILEEVAAGRGPNRLFMALGYTGWAAGQLDIEIKANGWISAPPDLDIIFDHDLETKWTRALAKIGIQPVMLSQEAGHA